MSGTQKVNKLSRKSKKKPTQSQKLDDSLADFSSADPSEQRTKKVEKKSDIFRHTQTKAIKSTGEQPERALPNNDSLWNSLDRGKYSSESHLLENVKVATSAKADPKSGENVDSVLGPLPTTGLVTDCAATVALADCPMCGKQFKPGLVGQRNAHLKSCGNKLGMKADKLVELRRLEERQAEERAALGFPIFPKTQPVDKPPKKVQRKSKPAKDSGADADLELALALSISAHNEENPVEQQQGGSIGTQFGARSEAELRVNGGTQVGSKPTEPPTSSQSKRASMWLPQAPAQQKKRGKKKIVGKTVLQTRSEEERERLVGEKVAALLYPEADFNPQLDRVIRGTLPERKCNERLVKFEDPDTLFWSLASLPKTVKSDQFLADNLENYIDIKQFGDCRGEMCDRTAEISKVDVSVERSDCNERILEEIKKSVQPSLKKLSDEWVRLLKSKKGTDLKILCKEEEVVLCHRLVLEVRCPNILNDTVKEIGDEVEEEIVIWSSFDYKLVMVFVEFLYGGILDLSVIETMEELVQLKQIAEFNKVKEIIDILMEVKIEEVHINDETGGFCEEGVDKEIPSATQNLDALLDCLDNFEKDEVEKVDEKEKGSEEEEEEDWDEVCQFMTQKVKQSVDRSQNVEGEEDFDLKLSDDDSIFDEEQNDVVKSSPVQSESKPSSLVEKSNSAESVKVAKAAISCPSSPDMFGSDDDDDDDIIETQWNLSQNASNHITTPVNNNHSQTNSSKRKLQLFDDCRDQNSKKHRTLSPLPPTSPLDQVCSPLAPVSSPSRPISSIRPISPVRLDFSDNSNELPTPTKTSSTKSLIRDSSRFSLKPDDDKEVNSDNDDVVDLTQPTPSPPDIPPCDGDNLVETAPSPISIKSSPVNFMLNSKSNSPKSRISSPKSSSSLLKSLSSTPKSSLLTSKPSSSLSRSSPKPSSSPSRSSPKSSSSPSRSSPLKSSKSTVNLINKLVAELGAPDVDDKHTETCLRMLCDLEVTVPIMLETGVGKLVRVLRDREGRIGRLAGRLVARWKKLVFAYDGPEVPKDQSAEAGLNSQKPNQSPAKVASNEEQVIGDCVEAWNQNKDHDKEVNSDIEQNGDIWQHEGKKNCDNADRNTDKDISYENDELARLQMEDSAIWRPESEPIPMSPQADTTPHRTAQSIKKLLTPQTRPKSATPLRIQSLKNCAAKAATPQSSANSAKAFMTPENVRNRQLPDATPMADYDMMLTPELREELHRFGLKAVPRRKAVQLLQFIYDKTHPFVDKENSSPYVEAKNLKKRNSPKPNSISKSKMKTSAKKVRIAHKPSTSKSSLNVEIEKSADCSSKSTKLSAKCSSKASEKSKDEEPEDEDLNLSQGSTCSIDSNGCDVPEESIIEMEDEDEDEITPSQILTEGNLQTQLRSLIHSRPDLHHSILIFEPIWLKEFFLIVKQAGIKCKLPQVMDFLDQECITFRTESNRNNRQKKKQSPKKKTKTSPVKPKSPKKKGGRKKKEPIS